MDFYKMKKTRRRWQTFLKLAFKLTGRLFRNLCLVKLGPVVGLKDPHSLGGTLSSWKKDPGFFERNGIPPEPGNYWGPFEPKKNSLATSNRVWCSRQYSSERTRLGNTGDIGTHILGGAPPHLRRDTTIGTEWPMLEKTSQEYTTGSSF